MIHLNSRLLFETRALGHFQPNMRVLEVGTEARPSSCERIVQDAVGVASWETADVGGTADHQMPNDYVIPLEDGSYDAVVAGSGIEHVREPWLWFRELARVVRHGGLLVLLAPASAPFHPGLNDYWRVSPDALLNLADEADLDVIDCRLESLEPPLTRRSFPGEDRDTLTLGRGFKGRLRRFLGWPQPLGYDTILVARKRAAGPPRTTPYWPPPGHYYSPIPDLAEVRRRRAELFGPMPDAVPGIDLRPEAQLSLLRRFAELHHELPFGDRPTSTLRYGFQNGVFEHGDGTVLYSMLRAHAPRRYVEIGSGWSSALALDVRDRFLNGKLEITLIEPNPGSTDEEQGDALRRGHSGSARPDCG